MRITVSFLVIAFTFAAAGGEAAAQTYPPLMPGDYYPAAPAPYPPPSPRPYANAPVPPVDVGRPMPGDPYGQRQPYYRDANGMLMQPFGPGPGYADQANDYQRAPYPPPPRPYFAPADRS